MKFLSISTVSYEKGINHLKLQLQLKLYEIIFIDIGHKMFSRWWGDNV